MEVIYNITAAVDDAVAEAWLEAVRERYLPALAAAEPVRGAELIEVLAEEAQPGSKTFTIQVRFDDHEALQRFKERYEHEAERELADRFSRRYVTFRLHLNSLHKFSI